MTRCARTLPVSLLALIAAGCGAGNSASTPAQSTATSCAPASTTEVAYALNGQSVSMYTVDSCTGIFSAMSPATVATGSTPQEPAPESMTVDPFGRFAYVANLVSNAADKATISMYTVNSGTGVLTATSPATVATGYFPQGITIDPSGKFVYTANSDSNNVSMFAINAATGVLTAMNPGTVAAGQSPLSVTVHPSGRFAYVANQNDDTISMYAIDPGTGVLTPTTPATVPTQLSPFGVAVDPSGRFAYVPNTYSNGNAVSQYTVDSRTGILNPNIPATVTAGNQPVAVAVDPTGRFAYVVNRLDGSVSMFTLDPNTGNLTQNGVIGAGALPFRIVFDPSGKFVYVANEASAASVYTVNEDGTLAAAGATGPPNGAVSVVVGVIKQ